MTITITTEETDILLTNDEGSLSIILQTEEENITCQIDDVEQLIASINFVMQRK